MSKQLPNYLDGIIDFMADCEQRHGGMEKEKTAELFRKELINESLTAKANPTKNISGPTGARSRLAQQRSNAPLDRLGTNPTVKPFHEIYDILGSEFNNSPLGRALGPMQGGVKTGTNKTAGRKVFEDIRNTAYNTASEIVEYMFGGRQGREGHSPTKFRYGISAGEYGPSGLKGLSLSERNQDQLHTEQMRYVKLLVASLIFGLIRPIFEMKKDELLALLSELAPQPKTFTPEELQKDPQAVEKEFKKILQYASSPEGRKKFVGKVIDLMREREGIVTAALQTTRYIGKRKVGGETVASNVITQLLELDEAKKS